MPTSEPSEWARKQAKELRAVMERFFHGPQTSEMMYAHLESLERKAITALDSARKEGRKDPFRAGFSVDHLYGDDDPPTAQDKARDSDSETQEPSP